MSLITIADIEVALGRDISVDEEPQVQFYIDAVSGFIERYVGRKFSAHEDQTVIARADSRGIIEVSDLQEVTSVEVRDPWTGVYGALPYYLGSTGYAFDGAGMIYGLEPYETYQIVCSYGITPVPDEIKQIAVLLVLAGSGLDYTAVNGLKMYRVGDVEESYGIALADTGEAVVTLSSLMRQTLRSWSTGTTTYRT